MSFDTAKTSGVLSNMPSTELAESAHEEEKWAAHAAISIMSPGKDEEEVKNQDRLMLMETTDGKNIKCQFAIVCDGATSSPYAAAAAECVSGQVQALFQKDGLRRVAATLKEMRLALLQKPLKMEEGQSALLRSMFEEIVQQKYQHSYQTTFVAVCLKREEKTSAGMISIKAIGCGDSALFIFRETGELIYDNANLADEHEGFKHNSSFTAVLPDCYDEESDNVLFDFKEYPEDIHLLLCSDGLYDGFTNFKEISDWLNEHRAELADSRLRDACLHELHHRLNRKKGDDDISFIWLHPNKIQAVVEEVTVVERVEENGQAETAQSEKPGFIAELIAALGRWFRLRTQ